MGKSIASKKSHSPEKEEHASQGVKKSRSPSKGGGSSKQHDDTAHRDTENSKMTYFDMIGALFVEEFNKQKKIRVDGVTYQQVWKRMSQKWPTTKKDICLKRLKSMVTADACKKGKMVKTEKGKFKFTANEILKPKQKVIKKLTPKEITHQQKSKNGKLSPLQKLQKQVEVLKTNKSESKKKQRPSQKNKEQSLSQSKKKPKAGEPQGLSKKKAVEKPIQQQEKQKTSKSQQQAAQKSKGSKIQKHPTKASKEKEHAKKMMENAKASKVSSKKDKQVPNKKQAALKQVSPKSKGIKKNKK